MKNKGFIFIILICAIACKKETIIWQENFNNNKNEWNLAKGTENYTQIQNHQMYVVSKKPTSLNFNLINKSNVINGDLEVKIDSIKYTSGTSLAGVVFGADSKVLPHNYLFFGFDKQGKILISIENKMNGLARTYFNAKHTAYHPIGSNVLKIKHKKEENKLYLYLNEQFLISIISEQKLGTYFGFVALDAALYTSQLTLKE